MFWQNDTKCRWEFPHELLDNKGHIRHIRPDLKGFSPNQFPQLSSALKKKVTPNSHSTCNWEQRINNHLPNVPLLRSYFIYLWFVWTSFFSFFFIFRCNLWVPGDIKYKHTCTCPWSTRQGNSEELHSTAWLPIICHHNHFSFCRKWSLVLNTSNRILQGGKNFIQSLHNFFPHWVSTCNSNQN